jgi:mRNA-degrading endonuclease toxin of MazEF toxin-antitoxin module
VSAVDQREGRRRFAALRIAIAPPDVQTSPTDQPYQWKPSLILVGQIRVLSRRCFAMRSGTSRIGKLSGPKMAEVEDALYLLLGLDP